MKKNKIIKLIFVLLIIFITLLSFNLIAYANDAASNPNYFKPGGPVKEKQLEDRVNIILGVINVVGIVISVITLMSIGIKYMLGSVEEKAEYKKTMGMYLLGAFLVFSITTIPNFLYKFSSKI